MPGVTSRPRAWTGCLLSASSWWNGDSGAASLARFATTGIAANIAFAVTFLVAGTMTDAGVQVRNVTAMITSTLLANDLHRRFSFQAESRVSWVQGQRVGALTAALGLAATSSALAVWNSWAPDAGSAASLAVVYLVNSAYGLVSFAALRWAFVDRAGRGSVPVRP